MDTFQLHTLAPLYSKVVDYYFLAHYVPLKVNVNKSIVKKFVDKMLLNNL